MLVCFASQTTGLCSPFPFGSLPCLHMFILLCWCAFASQTMGLFSAFPSAPFPVCTCLFVMLMCFASQTTGLCSAFLFGSLPRLHMFILLCWCALPRKQWVCLVLSLRLPSPFCTCLFVMLVCFASQTTGLCSAFPFCSLPHLHTFICYVGVLCLTTTGLAPFPI